MIRADFQQGMESVYWLIYAAAAMIIWHPMAGTETHTPIPRPVDCNDIFVRFT